MVWWAVTAIGHGFGGGWKEGSERGNEAVFSKIY